MEQGAGFHDLIRPSQLEILYGSTLCEVSASSYAEFSLLPPIQICWKHREINEVVILAFRKLNRTVTYVKT